MSHSAESDRALLLCNECGFAPADRDDEDICTCPNCGYEWGFYESEAGIRLFMAEVADNDARLFEALDRTALTDGSPS